MKNALISLFILFSFAVCSAQNYDRMWQKIEDYQEKDLPQSIINQAYEIFQKAQKEKNSVQMIKSFLTAMQYREYISADSLKVDEVTLEKMANESDNIGDKALLYTVLANIKSNTQPRTALEYIRKIMTGSSELVDLSDAKYKIIVDKGKFSEKYFKNNLLHIISKINLNTLERIGASPTQRRKTLTVRTLDDFEKADILSASFSDYTAEYLVVYQTLLREYKKKNMTDAWLITAADVVNMMENYSELYKKQDAVKNLQNLILKNSDQEAVAYAYSLLIERKCEDQENVSALEMIRKCISKYSNYIGKNYFINKEKSILMPSLSASIDNLYSGVENRIRVDYNNVSSVNVNLYKIDSSVTSLRLLNAHEKYSDMKRHLSLIRNEKHALTQYKDYKTHSEDIELCVDEPGIYYIELQTDKGLKDGRIIYVTSIIPIIQSMPGNKAKIIVLDALNGKPVCNSYLNIYSRDGKTGEYILSKKIKNDENGVIIIDSAEKIDKYNITNDFDCGMKLSNLYVRPYRSYDDYIKEKIALFTDRALYQPSQTVHFSGFAYTQKDDSISVLPQKEYEATLIDANNSKIRSINVTTDKFGSFSGSFILPSKSLNGRYRIKMISSEVSFTVEEYKRPSFHIDFQPVSKSFAIGDTVIVDGYVKTYSDIPVRNALVKYRIDNHDFDFYKIVETDDGKEDKITKTDNDGYFSFPVVIENQDERSSRYWYRRYDIYATVTDNSGENAKATTSLPYGSSSLMISIEGLKDVIEKGENDSLLYKVTNLQGKEVDSSIIAKLYRIEKDGKDSVLIAEQNEISNVKIPMKWANNLSSSKYKLSIMCNDEKGREALYTKTFVLFSFDDKHIPVKQNFWIYDSNKSTLSFGTSLSDVDIYFNILSKDRIIENTVYSLSDSIINIDCSYKKEYGDGVQMNVAFVKNGKLYTYNKEIIKPYPSKKLILKWNSFRNKLQPGNNEIWSLKIAYPDGKPASAQLITTMYDASLDAIYKHSWNFGINYSRDVRRYPYINIQGGFGYFNIFEELNLKPYELSYSKFNLPYLNNYFRYSRRVIMKGLAMDRVMLSSNKIMRAPIVTEQSIEAAETAGEAEDVVIRTNFAETAFFYPQLNTDKNGEIQISFTLPESLTKWHFMGLAHTENMDYGLIESEATASKEFMVKPSLPRFLRTGDICFIPVSVTNLKNIDMKGILTIAMIDPATNKIVYSMDEKFDVDKGETGNYQFEYKVPDNYSLLICRVIGKGKNYSDGEQNYLPILSDKEIVTESIPMIIADKGKYKFNIPSSENKNLTLEVTANPIWHVVQSLPIILTPSDDTPYSWATSLYASIINEYLLSRNPAISNISSQYKSAPSVVSKEMFDAELQKNQELKEIVLSETPWVAQAYTEERQRKMLTEIGDINQIQYTKKDAIKHLLNLQNADGSWSWYKKMTGNISITTDVLEALIRAKVLTNIAFPDDLNNMCKTAYAYLKNEVRNSYQQAVKSEKDGNVVRNVPLWIIKYIYISTLDNNLKSDDRINKYFIDKLKVNPSSLDIYEKSLCAVIFAKMNMKQDADVFLESLAQYTVYSKNLGRYFDTRKAKCTYSSNIIPSVVSTIEALQLCNDKKNYVEQMKQWLIVMKGMQSWNTNTATTNAIYALLNGENVIQNRNANGIVKIKVGNELLEIAQNEPLGYVKKKVSNNIRNVDIEKTYSGMSYGALYLQGVQKIDTLKNSSTGLIIKKRLFCNGKEINNNSVLKVGDVVKIRLELKSPAYMDFVQIKDPLYSCMQPCEQLSSVMWNYGLTYNKQIKNASLHFFIDKLKKGESVIEYDVYITKKGLFTSGLTKVESAYFPMMRSICRSNMIDVK